MIICILGRQPRIGLAELEALYGADKLRIISDTIALVDVDHLDQELGGTVKAAQVIDDLTYTSFDKLSQQLAKRLPTYLSHVPETGKIKFGISTYGLPINVAELSRSALFLKKAIKRSGRSVRVVPNNTLFLNSAQVIHNQLTSDLGLELVLVKTDSKIIVARTIHEQDIEAYTLRDRGRPMRDAFVGMLPPKLAQIMIHLAGATQSNLRLLDPFCGTGVVLQEAALYGYSVYGTDLSEKMIRYTRDNLVWLADTHRVHFEKYFHVADAMTETWQQPVDIVVCEGFLGQPMSQAPPREKLERIVHDCDVIMSSFLQNIAPQLSASTPLCVAAPAWFAYDEIRHLPCVEKLEEFGFERRVFKTATESDLVYHRDDQIVGRELLVLTKK